MRKILAIVGFVALSIAPATASDAALTVMSRNLYLGADVGVAMELIPDFSAAAQFMWNQVAATDFTQRAPALAKEVIAQDADVVGLQEATHWYCKKNLLSKRSFCRAPASAGKRCLRRLLSWSTRSNTS